MINFNECGKVLQATLQNEREEAEACKKHLLLIKSQCLDGLNDGYIFGGICITGVPYKAVSMLDKDVDYRTKEGTVTIHWTSDAPRVVTVPWELEDNNYYDAILKNDVRRYC
jgi:hypothetical protein